MYPKKRKTFHFVETETTESLEWQYDKNNKKLLVVGVVEEAEAVATRGATNTYRECGMRQALFSAIYV